MSAYFDIHIWKNVRIRSFKESTEDSEFIWHRDKNDRLCVILYGDDWQFQTDNQLPIQLKAGDHFVIPRNTYHRVIKGRSNLILIIKEFEHESTNETSEYANAFHNKANTKLHTFS